jgi:hypothetical protein
MDKSVIKRLATQCGIIGEGSEGNEHIFQFANAIAAHEREEMINLARIQGWVCGGEPFVDGVKHIAEMRSRGNK